MKGRKEISKEISDFWWGENDFGGGKIFKNSGGGMGGGKFLKFWGGGNKRKIFQNSGGGGNGGGNDQGLRGEFPPQPGSATPSSARFKEQS